jgi:hypothetical protein
MAKNFGGATVTYGVGFGVVLAMLISFSHTKSVLWTLIHGIFGWFYVIVSLLNGKAVL